MEGAETQTCLRGASLQTRVLKIQRKKYREDSVSTCGVFLSSLVDGCCCVCLFCLSLSTSLSGCTSPVPPCPGVLLQMDCFCVPVCFSLSSHFFSIICSFSVSYLQLPSALCSAGVLFLSLSASASISIPHFVLCLLSIELRYPSSGHLYCSKRTL